MAKIEIEITDEEMRALEYVAVDPVEWVTNFTKVRAAAAMEEIYETEIARMRSDPSVEFIPVNKASVVRNANIKSAAERHAEFLANPPVPPLIEG
jgi:hypothetical protein